MEDDSNLFLSSAIMYQRVILETVSSLIQYASTLVIQQQMHMFFKKCILLT